MTLKPKGGDDLNISFSDPETTASKKSSVGLSLVAVVVVVVVIVMVRRSPSWARRPCRWVNVVVDGGSAGRGSGGGIVIFGSSLPDACQGSSENGNSKSKCRCRHNGLSS